MANHVSGHQTLVKIKHLLVTFIHCYSYQLNLLITVYQLYIWKCKLFLIPSENSTFLLILLLYSCSKKTPMVRKLLAVTPTRWNFLSRLVNTLKQYVEHLIIFFFTVYEPGNWTGASCFVCFLCKFYTKFLLSVFHNIIGFSDVLFDTLQNKRMNIHTVSTMLMNSMIHCKKEEMEWQKLVCWKWN